MCYDNLEELSIPYDWVISDELPRNLGGKVDTNLLLDIAKIDYMDNKEPKGKVLKLRKWVVSFSFYMYNIDRR